jgi:hypothetical protein
MPRQSAPLRCVDSGPLAGAEVEQLLRSLVAVIGVAAARTIPIGKVFADYNTVAVGKGLRSFRCPTQVERRVAALRRSADVGDLRRLGLSPLAPPAGRARSNKRLPVASVLPPAHPGRAWLHAPSADVPTNLSVLPVVRRALYAAPPGTPASEQQRYECLVCGAPRSRADVDRIRSK